MNFMRVWWNDGQVIDYVSGKTPDLRTRRDWKKAEWLTMSPSDQEGPFTQEVESGTDY